MSKKSNEVFTSFKRKLNNLDKTRRKQEILYTRNQIVRKDIEQVYSALFLSAWGYFEAFIEELFIGLLVGKIHHSKKSTVNSRVNVKSEKIARDLIYAGKKYVNWFPYENSEYISKIFFTGGRPFTSLEKKDKQLLQNCLIIRNALAHQSRHSTFQFNERILKELSLYPREKKPQSFLRSQFSASPDKNRYEHYIDEIIGIATKLC